VPASETPASRRIATVDLLRGLLMIIMALDHTRDFFSSATVDPTSPDASWPALFFTRWITHLCAPGFVALAGTSVYLQSRRGRTHNELAKKLVTRGLWFMFMEVAIVNFGLFFTYKIHFLQVIYAIGGSMIILAALQYLPTEFVACYGVAVIALHNLTDGITAAQLGHFAGLATFLIRPGVILLHGKPWIVVAYPVLPWSGIMAAGYAFGAIVMKAGEKRRAFCAVLGSMLLAVFAVLRFTHAYGDPVAYASHQELMRSAMSLFQVTKYPPSLDYVLATFGFLLLLFALGDLVLERRWVTRAAAVVEVYGRVPFFYYVPHFYIIHLAMIGTLMVWSHSLHPALFAPIVGAPPPGWGFGLPVVYAIWIAVVAVLYLPCKWFAGVKARRRDWWLSYL